jgi:hypothetical protein
MKSSIIALMMIPTLTAAMQLEAAPVNQVVQVEAQSLNDEELDSLLAPIALYPDTLLTHILVASTYPLQVIEADRWRQGNLSLSDSQLQSALAQFPWDPSVQALVPFSDLLHTMSEDLNWLENLGDMVIADEEYVLSRVQSLRSQALEQGNLTSNDYQNVERQDNVIVIEPHQPEVIYVPYYDPLVTFGIWHSALAPVIWHHPHRVNIHTGIYWGSSIRIATSFYFGRIWWPDRHIVLRTAPIKSYQKPNFRGHYNSRTYQRWVHKPSQRHARYSTKVIKYKPQLNQARHQHKVNVTKAKLQSMKKKQTKRSNSALKDNHRKKTTHVTEGKKDKNKQKSGQRTNTKKPQETKKAQRSTGATTRHSASRQQTTKQRSTTRQQAEGRQERR